MAPSPENSKLQNELTYLPAGQRLTNFPHAAFPPEVLAKPMQLVDFVGQTRALAASPVRQHANSAIFSRLWVPRPRHPLHQRQDERATISLREVYFTLTRMMNSVYRAIDSIRTSAKINMFRIAPLAPGFRAIPSNAEAEDLAWAMPQKADAMAMAKPEVIATQLAGDTGAGTSAANTDGARRTRASTVKTITENFLMRFLLSLKVPLGGGSRHPRAAGITLSANKPN